MKASNISITGATGYLGYALSRALMAEGYAVRALVRPGTAHRAAPGTEVCELDLFSEEELAAVLRCGETVVHLIGTSHPNPSKAREFLEVDLASVRACAAAAVRAGV